MMKNDMSNKHNGLAPVPPRAKLELALVDWPSQDVVSPTNDIPPITQPIGEVSAGSKGFSELSRPSSPRLSDGSVASHATNEPLKFHERGEWREFPVGEPCRPAVLEIDLVKDPGEAVAIRGCLANDHCRGKEAVAMFLGGRVRIIDPIILDRLK